MLAIATHALFLGLTPNAPMGSGIEDPLNMVAVAIIDEEPLVAEPEPEEESPEPEEPAIVLGSQGDGSDLGQLHLPMPGLRRSLRPRRADQSQRPLRQGHPVREQSK